MEQINLDEFVGKYLPSEGPTCFHTLDGSDVAAWLNAQGYKVTRNGDTGRNGFAETADGYRISTNGYVTTY